MTDIAAPGSEQPRLQQERGAHQEGRRGDEHLGRELAHVEPPSPHHNNNHHDDSHDRRNHQIHNNNHYRTDKEEIDNEYTGGKEVSGFMRFFTLECAGDVDRKHRFQKREIDLAIKHTTAEHVGPESSPSTAAGSPVDAAADPQHDRRYYDEHGKFKYAANVIQEMTWHYFLLKNRYMRTFWAWLFSFFTTGFMYGWTKLSAMFFEVGMFESLCTEAEIADHLVDVVNGVSQLSDSACKKQDTAVQTIYLLTSSIQFLTGVPVGLFLDRCGPILCVFIGLIMVILGIVVLGFAVDGASGLAYLTSVLMAGGTSFILFAGTTLSEYFPFSKSWAVTVILSSQSASSFVQVVLGEIFQHGKRNLASIYYIFTACCVVPSGIMALITTPYFRPDLNESLMLPQALAAHREKIRVSKERNEGLTKSELAKRNITDVSQLVWKKLCDPLCMIFTFVASVQILYYGYYVVSLRNVAGSKVADFCGNVTPALVAFGLLSGSVMDKLGTTLIVFIIVICGGLMFVTFLIDVLWLHYVGVWIYLIGCSYVFAISFPFVFENFPAEERGVVLGLIQTISGVFVLINIPLTTVTNITALSIVYIVLVAPLLLMTILTRIISKRRRRLGVEATARQALSQN